MASKREQAAQQWLEEYLLNAPGQRALQQSVFAAGELRGFPERLLRGVAEATEFVVIAPPWWSVSEFHVEASDTRRILELGTWTPDPRTLPAVTHIDGPRIRPRQIPDA